MDANSLFGGLNLDSKSFKQLLDSQSLVDCTLACDGGKISVHKIVLLACSSYLAKILQEHPVEHPIIILPELKIEDVKALVHYMYTGELLKSDTLNSVGLLRTAAILSINSLNDFLNGTANIPMSQAGSFFKNDNNNPSIDTHSNTFPDVKLSPPSTSPMTNCNSSRSSPGSASSAAALAAVAAHLQNGSISANIGDKTLGKLGPSKSEFQFKCPVCQNDFQTICSFEYHMQRIHNVTSFGCEICHKPFASLRYVLTDHMRRCHGWQAEQKLQC